MADRPKFNAEEQSLIDNVLSQSSPIRSSSYVLTYLCVGAGLGVYGLINSSSLICSAGLVVVVFARMQEMGNELRLLTLWQSILGKYEKALEPSEQGE
ncbi:MAG: hypothetical protein KDB22_24230 [Planctomycetales bacterium]|nr:hypothetical protein [Planctomycetales bacterium]